MNSEKISQLIKDLRKKNSLTQQEFANLFGVTYQAVSKWENGKNMPDIEILKQICETYHLDISNFLKGEQKKKKQTKKFYIIIVLISLTLIFFLLWLTFTKSQSFEFKTLTTSCNNFKISGSIAYNDQKSSIYISHIDYCGGNDTTIYQKISCTLYETHNNTKTKVDYIEKMEKTTLEEFLKDLSFYIDNYRCEAIKDHTFHLEINAEYENEKINSYYIPLNMESNCLRPNSTKS